VQTLHGLSGSVKDSGFSSNPYSSHFLFSQFILLIFYSCKHLQSAGVCCDSCDCTFSQECDSVTSALFQRLRYEFMSSSLFFIVSHFSFRQSIR